jgi:hypothetical protein
MRELNSSLLVPPLLLTSLWPLPLLLLLVRTSHARTPLQPPAAKMVPKDAAAPKWQSGHSTVTTPWLVELPDPGVRTSITCKLLCIMAVTHPCKYRPSPTFKTCCGMRQVATHALRPSATSQSFTLRSFPPLSKPQPLDRLLFSPRLLAVLLAESASQRKRDVTASL